MGFVVAKGFKCFREKLIALCLQYLDIDIGATQWPVAAPAAYVVQVIVAEVDVILVAVTAEITGAGDVAVPVVVKV